MDRISSNSRQACQQPIMQAVMARGNLRIWDLTHRFAIGLMTPHHGPDEPVAQGPLRKTRGMGPDAPIREASDLSRQRTQTSAIALPAAHQVEPRQAVFPDDSMTVPRLVPHLAAHVPLTAITNSLTLMTAINALRDLPLLGLGGQFRYWCNALMGPQTIARIRRLRAGAAVLSIADAQMLYHSPRMAKTGCPMPYAASRRILLADHTDFTRRALRPMRGIEDFDLIITADRTPPDRISAMRRHGATVRIATVGGQTC